MFEESLFTVTRYVRGKLNRFTQACGNRRFTRSGRFKKWREGENPNRPVEAVRGDPSARKGLFHEARRVG